MAQRMGCRETRRCYTAAITFAPSNQRPRVGGVTMQQVTVRAPASTSNLGPGFDCLGVALSLYNKVTLKSGTAGGGNRMVRDAARKFFGLANCTPFDFSCDIRGNVPIGRGLGSSVTVRLGVLHALNEIARTNLSRDELFTL